jgi:multidrug resistance efflux pump
MDAGAETKQQEPAAARDISASSRPVVERAAAAAGAEPSAPRRRRFPRIDLADTDVRAPIDGMVTNTVLAPGQFASSGRRVATIIDTASAWVIANLPENTLGHVAVGDPVLITFNVAPGQMVSGHVASLASGVAQTLSAAAGIEGPLPFVVQRRQWLREVQRVPVRIELDRQQDIPVVRVGSRANVVVITSRAGAWETVGRAWLRLVSLADYVF